MLNLEELRMKADKIPSMGGREMGLVYNKYIKNMKDGINVVEIGVWLGAGSAQLAMAMYEHKKRHSTLHLYDQFEASGKEMAKARDPRGYPWRKGVEIDKTKGEGVNLYRGQDTLPIVKEYLSDYKDILSIDFHKCRIRNMKYSSPQSIGIIVIDAAKGKKEFDFIMDMLEPNFVSGETICFFMDYYFYLYKKKEGSKYQEQRISNDPRYELLESYKNLCCAVVKFKG